MLVADMTGCRDRAMKPLEWEVQAMTVLYPSLGSPKLQPYEAPFGRMMLAYGRAFAAIVALVATIKGNEAEAVAFVESAGMKELPKRLRHIVRGKLKADQFKQLSESLTNWKLLADKRHRLIHGEWWFNVFEDNQLAIRGVWSRKKGTTIKHLATISAEDLDGWAKQLDEIADTLDLIEYHCRHGALQSG
jgi:hypothetical protein